MANPNFDVKIFHHATVLVPNFNLSSRVNLFFHFLFFSVFLKIDNHDVRNKTFY
jgi:hypothetical protein